MSAAQTDAHYEGTPGARTEGAVTIYKQFEAELDERSDSLASMLPNTVTPARFKNTVIAAVRQDPSILQATIRSVMAAVVRAAQDGLVPDGREGVITVYNVNVAKKGERDRWERRAQWNAMAHGLRKRMRELDGIIANAEVVHENDLFVWHQGDDPRIEHVPAQLGVPRGKMIGAYCIYKREDGTILHREVMDFVQIEQTRDQSKAKDSLMWTKFASEGYRKSVLRRGVKTVPVSDQMREIIQRDDEDNFDFRERPAEVATLVPPTPPEPPAITKREPEQKLPEMSAQAAEKVPVSPPEPEPSFAQVEREARGEGPLDEMSEWLDGYLSAVKSLTKLVELERMDDEVCKELDGIDREDLRTKWNEAYLNRKDELKKAVT